MDEEKENQNETEQLFANKTPDADTAEEFAEGARERRGGVWTKILLTVLVFLAAPFLFFFGCLGLTGIRDSNAEAVGLMWLFMLIAALVFWLAVKIWKRGKK